MKTCFVNNNSIVGICFEKRNKKAREADAFERKTREVFPTLSTTYMDDFYLIFNKDRANIDNESQILFRIMESKIKNIRSSANFIGMLSGDSLHKDNYLAVLRQISKSRVGNCEENAKAATAVLFANGYYNSSRVGLEYEVKFLDKKTKKLEYSLSKSLNHSFAVTDLNERKECDIVIDTWLGFADLKQGAVARYKNIYKDAIEAIKAESKENFYNLFHRKEGFNLDNYEMRTSFLFIPRDCMNAKEKVSLGECVKEEYPGVLLNTLA